MSLKNKFKESGKTLRDIMVVVIGIAITFSLNNWISKRNERKDVQQYLNTVKLELEANLKNVEENIAYHKEARELRFYLGLRKPDTYQYDELEVYERIIRDNHSFIYRTSAFEMFKMSGAMRLLKDKELLSDIWNTYEYLEIIKNDDDNYTRIKHELMYNYLISLPYENTTIAKTLRIPEAQRYFEFLKIRWNHYDNFLNGAEQIRKTLGAIENQKKF